MASEFFGRMPLRQTRTMQASSDNLKNNPRVGEALLSLARQRRIETGLIARLMCDCETFREICADYDECCAKLIRLEQEGDAAGGRMRDYLEMRDQLERELLRHLVGAARFAVDGKENESGRPENSRVPGKSTT